jgi:hypothetical protein
MDAEMRKPKRVGPKSHHFEGLNYRLVSYSQTQLPSRPRQPDYLFSPTGVPIPENLGDKMYVQN